MNELYMEKSTLSIIFVDWTGTEWNGLYTCTHTLWQGSDLNLSRVTCIQRSNRKTRNYLFMHARYFQNHMVLNSGFISIVYHQLLNTSCIRMYVRTPDQKDQTDQSNPTAVRLIYFSTIKSHP